MRRANSVNKAMRRFFAVLRRHFFRGFVISFILFLLLFLLLTSKWKQFLDDLIPEKDAILQILIIASSLITIFITFLWKILLRHMTPQTFAEKKDFILMVTQIIGGVTLLIGLAFTWQNINSTRKMSEETLKLSKETLSRSTQAQSAERFAKAAEQLGSKDSSIRTAGAYSLGNFTSDTNCDYYHITIRFLAGCIRENSKLRENKNAQQDEGIPADIQAALEVLGWRKGKWGKEESQRLNLSNTYLRKADLKSGTESEGAHLEGALLTNANLEESMLRYVNLEDAILVNANLKRAILYGANLQRADLRYADLEGADLQEAKGLKIEKIKEAFNWRKATFSQDFWNALQADQ